MAEGPLKLWLRGMLWPAGPRAGQAHDAHSRSLRLGPAVAPPSVASAERRAPQCSPPWAGGRAASEHRQVVAGLGAGLEGPAAGAAGCQARQEAPSSLAEARPPSWRGGVPGAAVLAAQAQLAHHALEELGHVVLQGGRGLDELAVEHYSAGASLWEAGTGGRGGGDKGRKRSVQSGRKAVFFLSHNIVPGHSEISQIWLGGSSSEARD